MISSLLKIISFIMVFLLSLTTLLIFFVKFIVLNEVFYVYSLQRNDTYKNLTKAVKEAARETLINQVNQSEDYSKLTVGERQQIDSQIENYTSFINEANVKNFLQQNIGSILSYLGSNKNELIFYLPIKDWGLSEQTLSQIPDYLKNGQVSAKDILKQRGSDTTQNLSVIQKLAKTHTYLTISLIASIVSQTLLIVIYVVLYKKGGRSQVLGKLLFFIGIGVLLIAWILFTANNVFTEGTAFIKTGWTEILAGTLVQLYATPLVYIFTVFGLISLTSGIVIFNKKTKSQLVTEAKLG